jgi:hypothetical protein
MICQDYIATISTLPELALGPQRWWTWHNLLSDFCNQEPRFFVANSLPFFDRTVCGTN